MAKRRHTAEQIINKLREGRVELAKGPSVSQVRRKLGTSQQACYRWRKEYGGWRAEYANHVQLYGFVSERTHHGRALRVLAMVDECTRACLALMMGGSLKSEDMAATLTELYVERGVPACIRLDDGPEFTVRVVREWSERLGVQTLFTEPGSLLTSG